MAKTSIEDVLAIKDPMLSDNYGFSIANVPGSGNDRPLTIQCKSVTKPGMQLTEVEYALFGHNVKHAGQLTYTHEFTAEFYETNDGIITRTIEDWIEYCRKHTTQHGNFKKDYAKDAKLIIYDQVGNAALTYKLVGVWPASTQDLPFDGSSATGITQSISFKFDYYELVSGG